MRGLDIQKFKDRDKQEVQGYYELLQNIFEAWETTPLNESTIKFLHSEFLKYVDKFDTTPAYLTPKEMQELIEWTRIALSEGKFHALLVIANFLVEFLNIHPFQDGNGRVSRILTNLLLLKAGYLYIPYVSHEKLIEDNKPEYYLALRKSQKTIKTKKESIVSWLEFFLTILLKQSQMAVDLLSTENVEKLFSEKQIQVWQYLQTVQEASPREIEVKTKIARSTINQVLDKLLNLQKIERLGLGRSTRYRLRG